MRLAVVGKGGTGKSVICGTLARILARRRYRILALDMDTMPGLAFSLGLSRENVGDAGLPEDVAEKRLKKGWRLKKGVNLNSLVFDNAVEAPDGIRFLQLGKLPDRVKPHSSAAFWCVLKGFKKKGWHMLTDLAAGTRQPFFGWSNFADIILVTVEPSSKATLSAGRLAKLAQRPKGKNSDKASESPRVAIIANKLRHPQDWRFIHKELRQTGLPILAEIPYDDDLITAEQSGVALIDFNVSAPAVKAIEHLANELLIWANHSNSTPSRRTA